MSRRLSALFTWRSAVTGDGSDASALERHVALTLALFMSEAGDSAFPSVQTLAGRCGRSESTVRGALRELERKGWLETSPNRGRGHTNVYRASIPDQETHLTQAVSGVGETPSGSPTGGAESTPATLPDRGGADPSHDQETRLSQAGLAEGESRRSPIENRRGPLGKPPGSGPNHVSTTSVPRQQQPARARAAADPAAAVELRERLAGHGVDGRLLELAVADPERAAAWVELAETAADLNVGGYFRAGFQQGGWPGPRLGAPSISLLERRRQQVEQLVRNLGVDDGPAEARYRIDHEWDTLTVVERSELHLLVDELRSELLPNPAAATGDRAEVA